MTHFLVLAFLWLIILFSVASIACAIHEFFFGTQIGRFRSNGIIRDIKRYNRSR